jgi:hypothetical protein
MRLYFLNGLRYTLIAGALAASVLAFALARASALYEQDTAPSVTEAVHLFPNYALYLDRLANWQPEQREALLRRSVELDPFDYDAWTRLGLLTEMQNGDVAGAEKDFLQAAEVNHMFMPRWTLANFYYRQQNVAEFFRWSRLALEVTPYASEPIFSQMWAITQDEGLLSAAIPDRPRIILQYAWFLANNRHFDAVPPVIDRLVRLVATGNAQDWGRDDLIAIAEDHMLQAGAVSPAIKVWASLNNGGWIKQAVPDAYHPLTNGDFRIPFYRHGFDWVGVEESGVRIDQITSDSMVRINLFGDQADKVVLMQQYVDVEPGKTYVLSWQARSQEILAPSGLAWRLHPIKGGPGTGELVSGDLLADSSWNVAVPADAKAFLLTLECHRPLGSMRARGTFSLQAVSMSQQ